MTSNQSPTLVLLPGLDGTGLLFEPLLAVLPSHIRTHVVSYPPDQPLSLAEYAALVRKHLPKGDVVLLAESFSGLVALSLLVEGVASIKAVIFVAAFAEPPRPYLLRLAPLIPHAGSVLRSAPAFLLRQFCLGRFASSQQLAAVRRALAMVTPDVLSHRLSLVAARRSIFNQRFSVPCHYVQASEDHLVPKGAARWFAAHFDAFHLETIDGPHFLLHMRAGECGGIIAGVVAGVARK